MTELIGIRHLSRTETPPNLESFDANPHSKKSSKTKGKKKNVFSRFLKFIKGGDKKTPGERQKSTDSTSSGVSSNNGIKNGFNAASNSDEDKITRGFSKDSGFKHSVNTSKGNSSNNSSRHKSSVKSSHSVRQPEYGIRSSLGPKRANTVNIPSRVKTSHRKKNKYSSSSDSTSDSSSTGYLSDESRKKQAQKSRPSFKRRQEESSDESSSSSEETYTSSEVSVYSPKNKSKLKSEENSEENSSDESPHQLETILENEEEPEKPQESEDDDLFRGPHDRTLRSKSHSIDNNSGSGMHKPKPIWRRRNARPMSFHDNPSSRPGVLRSESARPVSSNIRKFEGGNVRALAQKIQAQSEQVDEDDVYMQSQFARARRFFRSGSTEDKASISKSFDNWHNRESHDNDDDLLAESQNCPTSLTSRRAGFSQDRCRGSVVRKNSFQTAPVAEPEPAPEPERSAVQRSTSRVRQIAFSLHQKETTVRKAEAMIANHQPLVEQHAASASSSSERTSTGHPSPQHKMKVSPGKKHDDSFIKELLEIARAESQEKQNQSEDPGLYILGGNRAISQHTLESADEGGDRKPKDFKEAISMASNRLIRKKPSPSQDNTEPEDGVSLNGKKLGNMSDTSSINKVGLGVSSSLEGAERKRVISSDYQYQNQVKERQAVFENMSKDRKITCSQNSLDNMIADPEKKVKRVVRKVRRVSKKKNASSDNVSREGALEDNQKHKVSAKKSVQSTTSVDEPKPVEPVKQPSVKKVTKVIKKKKIVKKVSKKPDQETSQQAPAPAATVIASPEPITSTEKASSVKKPRESVNGEDNEKLDPFVREVLNSRAIPNSVKQKIREECWSLFNDPKTPRGVKQCILDNMVSKARQE